MAKKKVSVKTQKMSPLSGFGKDRLRNILSVGKNASTTSGFTKGYTSRAKNYN